MTKLAPICLFTYNRLDELKITVESLKKNILANQSDLFVFSDGPKKSDKSSSVSDVRDYLYEITGFKSIKIFESETNKGLAKSIIQGVTQIIKEHGMVIVIEDDLILSKNFLSFMNLSLEKYENKESIFSISGFCLKMKIPDDYKFDVFFWGRSHSWGWGTWIDRWESIDWQINDWDNLRFNKGKIKQFNEYGTDLFPMLKKSMEGKVNSWFIRFTYNQFKQKKLTVYPFLSKVINNGFMDSATHCNVYNRNIVVFDKNSKTEFNFSEDLKINSKIKKQLTHYKSYSYRIVGKILTILMRYGVIKQRVQS